MLGLFDFDQLDHMAVEFENCILPFIWKSFIKAMEREEMSNVL